MQRAGVNHGSPERSVVKHNEFTQAFDRVMPEHVAISFAPCLGNDHDPEV